MLFLWGRKSQVEGEWKEIKGHKTVYTPESTPFCFRSSLAQQRARVFSVWICSRNLSIPLLPEARPMYLLDLWKIAIVPQFTNLDPQQVEKEVPELFYKCV